MNKPPNKEINFFFPFPGPLVKGKIITRYKRFLADIELKSGELVTAHVANSGSMTTCWQKNAEVVLTKLPDSPTRKLGFSLQAVQMDDGWVGVNTMNPNKAVFAAIKAGKIAELNGYKFVQSEVKTFTESRFDLAMFNDASKISSDLVSINLKRAQKTSDTEIIQKPACLVEIKNATLKEKNGVIFPDAKTVRGQKHLLHLIAMKEKGFRSVILFFAGRSGTEWIGPADSIDKEYGKNLRKAIKNGVETLGLKVNVSEKGLTIVKSIPVLV